MHEFCEQHALPCLFPNVEVPVVADHDFYSLYFSKAVLLEAQLIAKAMAPNSRLLIVELIMTNPPTPFAAAVDLFMCITAGKERTIEMFESLTADAGLRITRVVPGKTSEMGVLECMKV